MFAERRCRGQQIGRVAIPICYPCLFGIPIVELDFLRRYCVSGKSILTPSLHIISKGENIKATMGLAAGPDTASCTSMGRDE